MVKSAAVLACALFALLSLSCSDKVVFVRGEACVINTDCASPLGCRLGACRRICVASRDCGAGLRCLIASGESSGGCQFPEEASCTLDSQCPGSFRCIHATCTVACVEDEDCPVPGSICVAEVVDGVPTGSVGCTEPLDQLCIYDSDCPMELEGAPFPLVCAFDGTCQIECQGEEDPRDCVPPRVCRSNICELP